ncbi:general substrate transporter [Exophiala viscosa]|uniref:General substrate transporter n=1 Tax=Exophiala viscosa TaxID=2486360 RepID=A0AAN6DVM4_9EURO|nr:general substrate transporter [Exophiala viscosa]KAI1625998.1 general substrate transporter [Exophiala viscosa]
MTESRMQAALLRENPRVFRKSFLKLYGCLFVGYLCSATNGFDSNTFGGLSAIPAFKKYFGITTSNQGLVAALYVIGNIAGSFFAGPCSDRYGRRVGMATGSVICIIGAILQTAGTNLSMLMGGRFILGMGAVLVQTAGPSYVVEMSYPKYRAQLTGAYQAFFFMGTIISTWLEYGLNHAHTSLSYPWRLPLAIQGLPSVFILCFISFIPESPRWYVSQGRLADAKAVLVKYHGDGDPDALVAKLELQEMQEVIQLDGSDKRWWDFRQLFNTREARYRTFLVTCIAWFGELDLPPTSYYFPLMVKTVGITSVSTQLLLNAIQTPVMAAAAFCGINTMHKFGRRNLLMFSSTGMAISMAIITACTARQAHHPAVGGTGIAFLYIFLIFFAFAWTPMQSLYPVEVLAYNSRAKGMAYLAFMSNAVKVMNTYVPPIAIANSGWKYYLLYVIWDAFGVVVIYFFFVETRGWSLEEIEQLFRSKNPVKSSLEKKVISVAYDGKITDVTDIDGGHA